MKTIFAILTSLLTGAVATPSGAAPKVTAELQPPEIALGDSARLIVRLSGGSQVTRPDAPNVAGLQISAAGQSSQIQIVNGKRSSSVSFSFIVTPRKAGYFEIPPIKTNIDGRPLATEPLKLRVLPSNNSSSAPFPPAGSSKNPTPPPSPSGKSAESIAFVKLERADNAAREHLYVGELTPIAIRAYFREGVQVNLNSRPKISDPAFTLRGLCEEPDQQIVEIDNQRYRAVTWYAGLSGVKAGEFDIEASLEATIGIPVRRDRTARRSPFDRSPFGSSLFDDPFFDSVFDDFFAQVERRELKLTSEKIGVNVKSLPSSDKPAHFDGAIGQFKIDTANIPSAMSTGDPVTLSVTVSGKGNFDRVTQPGLLPKGDWKTYSAKEKTTPEDQVGFKAKKTFELPVIPLKPGDNEVKFSFAYFDPELGEFQTIESQSKPVKIAGEIVKPDALKETDNPSPSTQAPDVMAPARTEIGGIASTFAPLYQRTWFIATQGVAVVAMFVGVSLLIIRRRREKNPEKARQRATKKAISEQLALVDSARIRNDSEAFFSSARRAIQLKLADHWRSNPDAISTEEVTQRLPRGNSVEPIFAMADAIEFSGSRPDPDALAEWLTKIETALSEIDRNRATVAEQQRQKPESWGQVSAAS